MRQMLAILGAGVLAVLLTASSRADDADQARAIIDKAIKAMGGEEKLAKFNSHTWKTKGTYYGMGDGVPYTANYAVQWPDKFRFEVEGFMIQVLDGDKGWVQTMGDTREYNKEEMDQQKEDRYAGWVTQVLPLKDKSFQLSLLGETKVADKPAVGVKVSHKDHQDVNLFFDKETGLLVKSEHKTKAQEEGNKEVNQESLYTDYQEVEGVKVPMKINMLRDGKKFVESETVEIKPVEKHDEKTFTKPG